jgi:hypothetical protein
MAAEIVDLATVRRRRRLMRWLGELRGYANDAALPTPEELGWTVLERDATGRPLRAFCPRHRAMAGYVEGQPDLVYVDYRRVCRAYALSLEELLVGLDTGFLPDAVAEVDSVYSD